jgi:dienelactone hydrolase
MQGWSEARALDLVEKLRRGRFDQIHEAFAPQLRSMVTADALRAAWEAECRRLGPLVSVGQPVSEPTAPGTVVVRVPLQLERDQVVLVASMAEPGVLVGLQLAPVAAPGSAWQPPEYADPTRFQEEELTVGSEPLAVPGTLSLPHQAGAVPAVVLLSGSGPHDRDETIGANKPLKDLAWGLASRGVAALRFEKVTYAHPGEIGRMQGFTVVDEYVPQALAAVQLLRRHPGIDPGRIFLLGHSLGGTVAPRVAALEPSIVGLVVLAGGTQPLHWAAVRQLRYLASLEPATAAASQPTIELLTEQARLIDSAELSDSVPSNRLPFGTPASYWLDLRSYNPVAVAAALNRPMLILQGGRDYQVTVADDLVRWQRGLAGRPDVTIRIYPSDNHLFVRGAGPSKPAEYEKPGHVDPAVVEDVAVWLAAAM